MKTSIEDVIAFVRGLHTYMDVSRQGDELTIDTRDHGDVGEGRPGKEDLAEGRRVAVQLRERFPDLKVELDRIDEWVTIFVRVNG
jgi:hypothetical protein